MGSESKWAVLAKRLGMMPVNHVDGDPVLVLLGGSWTCPSDQRAQDLLVGRTLRVAWDTYVTNGVELDPTWVMDVWAESNGSEHRAEACLSLLDAVGYPASS